MPTVGYTLDRVQRLANVVEAPVVGKTQDHPHKISQNDLFGVHLARHRWRHPGEDACRHATPPATAAASPPINIVKFFFVSMDTNGVQDGNNAGESGGDTIVENINR